MHEVPRYAPLDSVLESLRQIAHYCISPDANIEPDTRIKLWMAPDGRHTEIRAANIETGVFIDELVHIYDAALVAKNAVLKFRATIAERCHISEGVNVG